MQKKIARILIQLDTNKGHVLRILPGPIMFMRMSRGMLAVYAEQAIEVDSDANVERTFHIYQSGNEVADGHIYVTSEENKLGAVYHLYENVGAVPENDRIVKLPKAKNDPRPLVQLLDKYGDDLFEINIVDCPKGVTLLEGARAPIEGVISVLQMYNGLYGYEIVPLVEEIIENGSTMYVSYLNSEARVRTNIRVVTKAEQMIEKAAMENAAAPVKKAPEYNYIIEVKDEESKLVIVKEIQVPESAFTNLLRSMLNKSAKDIQDLLDHVKAYEKGYILSTPSSVFASRYRLEVLGVLEV